MKIGAEHARRPKNTCFDRMLHAHLKDPDLRILDGSYYLPQMGRDPRGI